MSIKIIQILVAPEDCKYQGSFLGLGDDGVVYVASGEGEWEVYHELVFKVVGDIESPSLEWHLTVRSFRILRGMGIHTERDLIDSDIKRVDLIKTVNCGEISVNEIIDCMYNLRSKD
jgi:DNA-directed RNA polymerase alpha subunit